MAIEEGAHGVVTVTEVMTPRFKLDRHLKVDNEYVLSGSQATEHQQRMGHLPLLLHGDAKRVLYVGSATGETASAATFHPVEEIVLVELVPEVQALAAEHFAEWNRGVYRDPRTRVVVEDGRNHLRAAPERYDAVVTDLFVPRRPGVGAMYSREHFEAVREHLAPGGVFCQWLPLYQLTLEEFRIVAATFLDVFPGATLWRADFFVGQPTAAMVGFAGDAPPVTVIDEGARSLSGRGVTDRWISDPRALWMLYLGPLGAALDVTGAPRNTDARPVFEYRAGRSTDAKRTEFRTVGWPDLAARTRAAAPREPFAGRPASSQAAGAAFERAIGLVAADGKRAVPEAAAVLRDAVPLELLSPPDPTFAEFWPTAGPRGADASGR